MKMEHEVCFRLEFRGIEISYKLLDHYSTIAKYIADKREQETIYYTRQEVVVVSRMSLVLESSLGVRNCSPSPK